MKTELDEIVLGELEALYRFVYRRVRDEYKAEDIVQTTVLTAYRAYDRLRDKTRTRAWLWGIARNMVQRSFRASIEIPTDEIAIIDAAGVSYDTPESEYMRKCDVANIRKAIAYLSKTYRDVCVLFYLENQSYTAIAKELGIPLSSVKWRLNQTKSQLREELTNMEYMQNGYRKAIPLTINMGGWVSKWNRDQGNYDNADKALEGLLPQNICLAVYEAPKTVTQIACDLGVAAEYVEEALQKLVETQSVKQSGTKYRTMFPIWDAAANADVFDGNLQYARREAGDILDALYALATEIEAVGFYGCDKGIDRLMLFLIGFVCEQTPRNEFETDKLPFTGQDKAWYILATTAGRFFNEKTNGIAGVNSSGSVFGLREYYFAQPFTADNRFGRTSEQQAFYSLYLGESVSDEFTLSKLIESGKVVKADDAYRITVPVIGQENGEVERLKNVLAPVLEKTTALQKVICDRSYKTVKRYIPSHIADQAAFFGSYCAHTVLDYALAEELLSRNVTITQDMATWFIVK